MSDGPSVEDLAIGGDESDGVVSRIKSFLGISYEAKACDKCGAECRETTVYDPNTAAYGPTPAWECTNEECGTQYHREDRQEAHTGDLYGRE